MIERIAEWALSAEDDRQIAALLAASFDTDFGGRSYFKQRHHLRVVHREGGRIIGHMAVAYRTIRLGHRLVEICGLADVATAPEARGRGVASALLGEALAFARETPAAFFVLFGNRPLYAGHGFARQPNRMRFVAIHDGRLIDVREDTDDGLMVLPLGELPWDVKAEVDLLGPMF